VGNSAGQALTDHHLSSVFTRENSVPATTIGWPSAVRATIIPKGAATPRPCKIESTRASVFAGREVLFFPTRMMFAP